MDRLLFTLVFLIVGFMVGATFIPADSLVGTIPPTSAFSKILTSNGTINSDSYSSTLSILGNGVTVTGSDHSNTLYISSSASSGANDNGTQLGSATYAIFKNETNNILYFRDLVPGSGVTLSQNDTSVTIGSSASVTARETLADQINVATLLTSIGTSYVDVYPISGGFGWATLIDTNGVTSVRFQVIWASGVGDAGTQTCQMVDINDAANVLITTGALSTSLYDTGDTAIPAGLLNTVKSYKAQCKSTVGTDSPTINGIRVFVK